MTRIPILLASLFLLSSSAWSASTLKVTTPNGGEKWVKGKSYAIKWDKGVRGNTAQIRLLKSGKHYMWISGNPPYTSTTPNDGRFTWKIPTSVATGSDYKIRIINYCCHNPDKSDRNFSITESSGGSGGYKICKTGSKKIKWSSKKMYYYVNTKGGPSGALGAIKRGASVWNRVKGSSFKFIYRGRTTSRNFGKRDGKNIVAFGVLSSSYVGMNRYWYKTSNGAIFDSDIRFNTRYRWSTKKAKNAFDLQSVAAHEFGHSLCLKDLYSGSDKEKTMYGIFRKGETYPRTLHPADKRGIQALY
jgi:hypothetical protein